MPIRPATLTDLPALLALERQSPTAAHWSEQQYRAVFTSEPRRLSLVAEESAALQGFLVARTPDHEWEIENIVVAMAVRRIGVGTSSLRAFLDLARRSGVKAVFLEVRESNHGARSLYQKLSFCEAGRRRRYYRDPDEDGLHYRLDLS